MVDLDGLKRTPSEPAAPECMLGRLRLGPDALLGPFPVRYLADFVCIPIIGAFHLTAPGLLIYVHVLAADGQGNARCAGTMRTALTCGVTLEASFSSDAMAADLVVQDGDADSFAPQGIAVW